MGKSKKKDKKKLKKRSNKKQNELDKEIQKTKKRQKLDQEFNQIIEFEKSIIQGGTSQNQENPENQINQDKKRKSSEEKDEQLKTDDFQELILLYKEKYIDKSLWIKEVIESKQRIQVYTRPIGMGKTLLITKHEDLFQKQPVLFLSFPKNVKKAKTFEKVREYVLNSIQGHLKINYKEFDSEKLEPIETLIDQLYEQYKSKVYLSIDNYDYPLYSAINQPYLKEMIELYKILMPKSLAYNEKIQKIIICGRYQFELKDTFLFNFDSSLVKILNPPSHQYFGFTQEEVQELLNNSNIDDGQQKKIKDFYNGFNLNGTILYSPLSIQNHIIDLSKGKVKYPQLYQFSNAKQFKRYFKFTNYNDKDTLELILRVLECKIKLDYYSRLQANLLENDSMITNFLFQTGIITLEQYSDSFKISNKEVLTMIYKLYLNLLNINLTSQYMIQYFRIGDFKNKSKNYTLDFLQSNLNHIESKPEAYKHLLYALFLADNLGYIKIAPFKVEEQDAVAVIDEQTQRAWLIAIIFVRVRAQMRRQNLYILEKMKGVSYKSDELASIKRSYIVAFSCFGKENTIYCIEKKDFQLTDKKHTSANDIVLKL